MEKQGPTRGAAEGAENEEEEEKLRAEGALNWFYTAFSALPRGPTLYTSPRLLFTLAF